VAENIIKIHSASKASKIFTVIFFQNSNKKVISLKKTTVQVIKLAILLNNFSNFLLFDFCFPDTKIAAVELVECF